MFEVFRKKKLPEAERLYKIYKSVDTFERILYIRDLEFKKMILKAEEEALRGGTSIIYELEIDNNDLAFFNQIVAAFIDKLTEEGFSYTRELLKRQRKFTIHFSKPKHKYY